MDNASKVSILDLPLEILVEIFGYVGPATLKTVASLGPYFEYILNLDLVWRVLFIKYLSSVSSIDLDCVPGKRKQARDANVNIVDTNKRICLKFPSLSHSSLWKTELRIRKGFLSKISERPKKLGASHTKKSYQRQTPYLLTSVYGVHSNSLMDEVDCDFHNDRLIAFSRSLKLLTFMSLRKGTGLFQIDSYIAQSLVEQHMANLPHRPTVLLLARNFLFIGNSVGVMFLKNFTNEYFSMDNTSNQKYFNRHNVVDLEIFQNASPEVKKLLLKRLYISCIVMSNRSFVRDSLDLISGDLLGQVYGWNFHGRKRLFRFNVNDILQESDIIYPVLKIVSDFKSTIVVESLIGNFFVIEFDPEFKSHKITHIKLFENSQEEKTQAFECFSLNTSERIDHSIFERIVHSDNDLSRTFLDVDFTYENIYYARNEKIYTFDFLGERIDSVDSSLDSDLDRPDPIRQTKLVSGGDRTAAGEDASLHFVLYNSGKVVIHSAGEKPVVFKMIPYFLQLQYIEPWNYGVPPITKFDANSAVLLLCSYNGWMAVLNPLNGNVLKIIDIQIPNTIRVPQRYSPDGVTHIIPTTAAKLDSLTRMDASKEDYLPLILLRGFIVLDYIVQYFQISFENNLNVKSEALTEEAFLARKAKRNRKKNLRKEARDEVNELMNDQLELYEIEGWKNNVRELLLEKYNGSTDMTEEEELMLALALSESEELKKREQEKIEEMELIQAFGLLNEKNEGAEEEAKGVTEDYESSAPLIPSEFEPGFYNSSEELKESDKGKGKLEEEPKNPYNIDEDLMLAIELSKAETGLGSYETAPTEGTSANTNIQEMGLSDWSKPEKRKQKPVTTKNSKSKIKQKFKRLDLGSLVDDDPGEIDEEEELNRAIELSRQEELKRKEESELQRILELSQYDQ